VATATSTAAFRSSIASDAHDTGDQEGVATPSPVSTPLHPTNRSWINLVERWFAELTNKWLRRGPHRSIKELEAAIGDWIGRWNDEPKPFIWHKGADEILNTLATYRARIFESGH
jgi:hypothetical protein